MSLRAQFLRANKGKLLRPSLRQTSRINCTPERRSSRTTTAGFIAGAMVALLAHGAAKASNNFPDWVRTAAQQTYAPVPESTKAIVLLEETSYTVDNKGQAVEHVRRVTKILRPQGRDYGYPAVYFDKDSKILSMHVWSIDPAGHEYALKDNELAEVGLPGAGGELYNDMRARVADPPGRDPGGIVALEYEKRQRPYLAETNWHFQEEIPHITQNFTLVLPQNFTYTTTWAHHPKLDAIDLENRKYRWDMNNEPGIDLDRVPMSPAPASMAARMTVHYSGPGLALPQEGTWQGIGEWFDGLSKDRVVPTPDITAKSQALVEGKKDFYEKAEAIGEFVQRDIRYVAVEIGVGGFQPHNAGDIYKGKYGDCKDKAALLSAMLSSVGLHGALLMVHTERGVIDPDSPSIIGNHMIEAIEIPQGYESGKLRSVVIAKTGKRYLIFDPTWDQTPFGQLENNLQASFGVLMDGSNSQVIQLPVLNPELNTIRRSATFQLSADGGIKGSVTDKRFGDLAERRRTIFERDTAKQQQEYMDRVAGQDLAAPSLTDLKIENVHALNKDLTTTFSLSADHYGSTTGPLLMVRLRVLGSVSLPVDHKPRKVDVDLEQTMQDIDDFEIQIPDGYVVDEVPDPVKVDYGFASYESSTEVHGQSLHYKRVYTLKQITLPAAKYPELQRLAGVIGADEESRAILKRSH